MKNVSCAVNCANGNINVRKSYGHSCPQTRFLDHTHANSEEKNVYIWP